MLGMRFVVSIFSFSLVVCAASAGATPAEKPPGQVQKAEQCMVVGHSVAGGAAKANAPRRVTALAVRGSSVRMAISPK